MEEQEEKLDDSGDKAFVEVTGWANFGRVMYALPLFSYVYMIFSFFFFGQVMDGHAWFV